MKARVRVMLIVLLALLVIAGGWFGVRFYIDNIPSKVRVSETEYYQVSGDTVAIFYNNELQKATGIFDNGEVYLPISWVNAILNSRFYWDGIENILTYALPESLVYATEDTTGLEGRKLILRYEDKIFLSEAMIRSYTDVRMEMFTDSQVKKIFINDTEGEYQTAGIKKNTMVRTSASIKSDIIADLRIEDFVVLIDQTTETADVSTLTKKEKKAAKEAAKWQRVKTSTGYVGYIPKKELTEIKTENYQSTFTEPVYTNISMDVPVILAWHQITNIEANAGLQKVIGSTKGLNVISPTWFSLSDNEGNYTSFASADYVTQAHAAGIQVWALIDNFSTEINSETILSRTSTRQKLIKQLMDDAFAYDLDGINIDFEALKESNASNYIEFIRELSVSCRKSGLVLSIDNPNWASFNTYYNRREQGIVADYVINMGYDEHTPNDGKGKGSTASYTFVKDAIANCLTEVPPEKLINAVPFYTRVWTEKDGTTKSRALGLSDAAGWVAENSVELTWSDEYGQYTGEINNGTETLSIWMEDERSLGLKMNLICDSKLAGVACWKLGLDTPQIWDVVDRINTGADPSWTPEE